MIRLIDLLKEEIIKEELKQKQKIGYGKDHVVYDMLSDPSKVIKIAWGSDGNKYDPNSKLKQIELDPTHIEVFKKYPDLFAKVYKHNDRYAIIEKLNTKSIISDQTEIFNILSKLDIEDLDYFDEHNTIGRLFWLSKNRKGFFNNLLIEIIKNDLYSKSPKLELYINFINRILKSKLNKEKSNLDVIANNIGYDKEGRLKLLDF